MPTISSQLDQINDIKEDLKKVLLNNGKDANNFSFSAYPNAFEELLSGAGTIFGENGDIQHITLTGVKILSDNLTFLESAPALLSVTIPASVEEVTSTTFCRTAPYLKDIYITSETYLQFPVGCFSDVDLNGVVVHVLSSTYDEYEGGGQFPNLEKIDE